MPTLRPQRLSGLVVMPTVDSGGGIHSVSIGIDVGMSRTPPPQVVTREDLIVELSNPAEGSFEPIASPDPGPLPTRALRVVQARGEFTFGATVNPPTQVTVTVRGDRKTFPVSQVFTPVKCLGGEPKEGAHFPAVRPVFGGGLSRVPVLGNIFPRDCGVRRFDAPLNAISDAAVKSEEFEMEADFVPRKRVARCACCE